jgi:enolase-like protein
VVIGRSPVVRIVSDAGIPFVNADVYRELAQATSTPIHTGEQIYLRQNFKALIERNAVRVIGPDPCDVGGIAELKWGTWLHEWRGGLDRMRGHPPPAGWTEPGTRLGQGNG